MLNSFGSHANIAAFNIGFNILTQRRPVIFPSNQLLGFINPEMACKKIVVMPTDQLQSNDPRNVRKASILKHSFNVFPSFRKLYNPQFFCLIIVALQVWESQPHRSDTNIVRVFVGYLALERVPKLLQLRQNSSAANKDLVKREWDV